jgi:predicted nucleic acid-binding protein
MARRILDTNQLIKYWHRRRNHRSYSTISDEEVNRWSSELMSIADCIVTPVAIEFLAGTQNSDELRLARTFLSRFNVIDEGSITADDWNDARRLAERILIDGRRRTLADCLIRAVADRLGYDVLTGDTGMPRSSGRHRRRPR